MTEQNELIKISKSPFSIGIQVSIVVVIIFVLIWGGFRINNLNQEIKKIQETSQLNTQQLINFNQILGHALDIQAESASPSPVDIKSSLETFEKLNSLILHIESLKTVVTVNNQSELSSSLNTTSTEKKPVFGANAEIRWWSKVGHYLISPLKDYFNQLIKVQVMDSNLDQLAMTDYSQQLLKQEMVVRGLTARTLLLNGLLASCKNEIQQIKSSIEKNFLPNDPNTLQAMQEIEIILNNIRDLEKKSTSNQNNNGDKK
jgi:hypothetical protein